MAELGLNVYQVIQNELISREGNRQSLGVGFRLSILETKIQNIEATNHNSRIWKLHHSMSPIRALTPSARRAAAAQERKLLRQKDRDAHKDPKDPTKLIRDEEVWEVAEWFPRTLLEFKELQFEPERVRDLMEFYDVKAYRQDQRMIDVVSKDGLLNVMQYLETCMEELAMAWGLNWQRIEGLRLPSVVPTGPPAGDLRGMVSPPPSQTFSPPPPRSSTFPI